MFLVTVGAIRPMISVVPMMPVIMRPYVDYRARIAVPVWITIPIAVAIGISVTVTKPDRESEHDPY